MRGSSAQQQQLFCAEQHKCFLHAARIRARLPSARGRDCKRRVRVHGCVRQRRAATARSRGKIQHRCQASRTSPRRAWRAMTGSLHTAVYNCRTDVCTVPTAVYMYIVESGGRRDPDCNMLGAGGETIDAAETPERATQLSAIEAMGIGAGPRLSTPARLAAAEEALAAEEVHLLRQAEALERQVAQHKAQKSATTVARERVQKRLAAEADMQRWQRELRAEVDAAVVRMPRGRICLGTLTPVPSPARSLRRQCPLSAHMRHHLAHSQNRLNAQRAQQLARCSQFEQTLQSNIDALLAMQQQVRRRSAALDSAFDACVQRLSGAYTDSVARRREQLAQAP